MSGKMNRPSEREYRNDRRDKIQREAHAAVVQVETRDVPAGFADWWSDLRRGQLRVYGGTLRFFDTLHNQRRDDLVLFVAEALMEYAKNLTQDDSPQAA